MRLRSYRITGVITPDYIDKDSSFSTHTRFVCIAPSFNAAPTARHGRTTSDPLHPFPGELY